MSSPYPEELRLRVVEEYLAGNISLRSIAKKFSVSKSWVFRVIKKERITLFCQSGFKP